MVASITAETVVIRHGVFSKTVCWPWIGRYLY